MSRVPAVLFALSLALTACGGKSQTKPAAADTTHAAHHHEEGEEQHAHGAPGSPVSNFHEALAPLWHAPEGAQRVTDTCNKAGELRGLAQAIVDGGAPTGAQADYLDKAKVLVDACAALETECATSERAAFAATFTSVHEAFHAVAERAPQE